MSFFKAPLLCQLSLVKGRLYTLDLKVLRGKKRMEEEDDAVTGKKKGSSPSISVVSTPSVLNVWFESVEKCCIYSFTV